MAHLPTTQEFLEAMPRRHRRELLDHIRRIVRPAARAVWADPERILEREFAREPQKRVEAQPCLFDDGDRPR